MSDIIDIFVFFTFAMVSIISAFDSVYIDEYSMLDIFLSIVYLQITFWGIFSLLSYRNKPVSVDD